MPTKKQNVLKGKKKENKKGKKERKEVLSCTVEDIRKLADYIQAILDEDVICVLGNEALLKKEEALFGTLKPLVQA